MIKKTKSKKFVLDNSELIEEFFEEVKLVGIVSALPPHTFVWQINQAFNFEFERDHENEVEILPIYFSVYSFEEAQKLIEHHVFCNRNTTNYLLPEAKNIDFIWMIKGTHTINLALQNALAGLKNTQGVDHFFEIDPQNLKSKVHLIL